MKIRLTYDLPDGKSKSFIFYLNGDFVLINADYKLPIPVERIARIYNQRLIMGEPTNAFFIDDQFLIEEVEE